MNIIKNPENGLWPSLLERPVFDFEPLMRSVEGILKDVRENGDAALKKYTFKFDKVELAEISVSEAEISSAKHDLDEDLKKAIKIARANIELFHKAQLINGASCETTPGVRCWIKSFPIEKVGLYIPGGSAPLLSTVLMLGIPAKLAGCKEIVLCSPPGPDGNLHPAILYACEILDIKKVFRVGGAQAIAAMAYGTESIPAVYKIFGPGNQYVTAAKLKVSLENIAIDMPAGPSEVAIIADKYSNAGFIASDLLSQAEHGADSQVLLITDSEELIRKVNIELDEQIELLPRKDIAKKSLDNSKIILMDDNEKMIRFINEYAPEHLIISTRDYADLANKITNAGSVFLGEFSPESAGDYASGTNHTLPTNGNARAYSGVNMNSFMKKISFQEISKYGLYNIGPAVERLAEAEELEGHKNAVRIRMQSVSKNYGK